MEIRARARDLRSRTDPENVSGGVHRKDLAKPIRERKLVGPSVRRAGSERFSPAGQPAEAPTIFT
jgi:hypothetical protein